jgi:xylulokinase
VAVILAADLGGTSLKLGLVDGDGQLVATRSLALMDETPEPEAAEQDAGRWWDGFRALAGELCHESGHRPAAIAITGAGRSHVLVDARGRPTGPAIMFRDRRSGAAARAVAAVMEGSPAAGMLDAFHPLVRLAWLARERPQQLAAARFRLQPKDYLAFRLTGEAVADPVSGYQLEALELGPALRELGIPASLVPPCRPIGSSVGTCRAGLGGDLAALAGLPVVLAGIDTWCATLGIGVVHPGGAYLSSGGSEVVGRLTAERHEVPGLMSPPWGPGLWHLGGPSQAGAEALNWLARLLGREVRDLLHAAETAPPATEPLLFLPCLAGERVPLWDADARGAFWGLSLGQGPADLVRAVVAGVAFNNRLVLELAATAVPEPPAELRITGGAARSDLWCRTKADVLGVPIVRAGEEEAALVGAAMVAGTMLGQDADLAAAQRRCVRLGRRFLPDARRSAAFARLYSAWRGGLERAKPGFAELAAIRRGSP